MRQFPRRRHHQRPHPISGGGMCTGRGCTECSEDGEEVGKGLACAGGGDGGEVSVFEEDWDAVGLDSGGGVEAVVGEV